MFDEGLTKQVYYRIVRQTLEKEKMKVNERPKMKVVEAIKKYFFYKFIV